MLENSVTSAAYISREDRELVERTKKAIIEHINELSEVTLSIYLEEKLGKNYSYITRKFSLVVGIVLLNNKETECYDIDKERFKQYNDSPLYFHKFIESSIVFKQKQKYRLVKANE